MKSVKIRLNVPEGHAMTLLNWKELYFDLLHFTHQV